MENFAFIPIDELERKLEVFIEKAIQKHITTPKVVMESSNNMLSRKEAAKYLNISLSTLNWWTKQGTIIGYRINSRVLYKRIELDKALNKIIT
jgi:excisionase family DNA binding protein